MITGRPPISSVYLTNVENIPLSLCCIGGLAIVVKYIQCPYDCRFCPWESNLNIRSARVLDVDQEVFSELLKKYRPDIVFLCGGKPWLYNVSSELASVASNNGVFVGVKLLTCPVDSDELKLMQSFSKLCDIVLVEVTGCTDIDLAFSLVNENVSQGKHVEVVVVGQGIDEVSQIIKDVVHRVLNAKIVLPINILVETSKNVHQLYKFIDTIRGIYPLIHSLSTPASEFASILCPKCLIPVVVRSGTRLIKMSLDESCRCGYCKNEVVSSCRIICKAKMQIKVPVNIALI